MAASRHMREPFDPRQVLNGQATGQTRQRYAAGKTIRQQGDAADALFYLEQGKVALSVVSPTGNEAIVGLREPGDFLGLRSLMDDDGPRLTSAIALTECMIVRIEKAALARLLSERPALLWMFIDYLLRQRLRDVRRIINQTKPAEERLARILLQIANLSASGKAEPIKINQTMLANMVGTTRPRVSFFMNNFRRKGLIAYDRAGNLIVRNELRKVLQDPE